MRRIAVLITATVTAALFAISGVAEAAPPLRPNSAQVVQSVKALPNGTAVVQAVYNCNQGEHLWVAAKQVASRTKDPRLTQEGSSAIAESYLHSHRNSLICDGRARLGSFPIDTLEFGAKGRLKPGWAWVQFCLTKETGPGEGVLLINEPIWAWVS